MINEIIAICGTMLGIITGFILGRISRTQHNVIPVQCETPPKIVEDKRLIESINVKCEYPKSLIFGSEEENRDMILRTLSYDIADQIYKNRSKYIEYKVEEDYRMNRFIAHGALRIVKNT